MSFAVRKAEVACNTATGNQTISPPGGDPGLGAAKAVIFFGVQLTADGAGAHSRFFTGVATPDGGDSYTSFTADDNVATMIGGGGNSDPAAIKMHNAATTPTVEAVATVTTWNTDGSIVVNWSDAPGSAWRLHVVLFYGSDITNAKAGLGTTTAGTGSKAVTGIGFRPDFVMRLSTAQSTGTETRANSATFHWAMFTETEQVAGGIAVGEAADATNAVAQRAGRSFYGPSTGGTFTFEAERTSMDSDGWSENWITNAGANQWAYLALKGPLVSLGLETKPTSAATRSTIARPKPDTTLTPTFADTFTYSDGDLDTVSGGVWANPIFTGQNDLRVVSGKVMKAVAGTWSDGYTATNTFGDGDYVMSGLAVRRQLLWICLAVNGEGGVDGYAIDLNPGNSIRLQRSANDVQTNIGNASVNTIAAGDSLCLRKDGSVLSVWRYIAASSRWERIIEPVIDTTYSSGRIGLETNSATAEVDAVHLYPLPTAFRAEGGLLFSWGQVANTANDTSSAECAKLSLGAFDSAGNEGSVWIGHDDGAATAEANMRTSATKALQMTSDFTGTVDAECDVTDTATGFDAAWTGADATAAQYAWAVFGAIAAVKQVAAVVAGASSVTAVAARRRAVAAAVAAASTVTAAVTRKKPAAALVTGVSTVTAAVVRKRTVAVLVASSSSVTAAVTRKVRAQPLVAGASSVSAAVSRRRAVAAGVGALSTVTAAAGARRLAQAAVSAVSSVQVVARRANKYVAPLIASTSSVVATPSRRRAVAALVGATSSVTAAAGARRNVVALVGATSGVTAAPARRRAIAAAVASVSTVQALPTRPRRVQATVSGASSVTASAGARRAVSPAVFATSSVTVVSTSRLRRVQAGIDVASDVQAVPTTPVTILPTVAIGYYV